MSDIRATAKRDAEFDRLLNKMFTPDCSWVPPLIREAYELGKRHGREEGPAWHDAPTCAGLWIHEGEVVNITSVNGTKINMDGTVELIGWRGRFLGPLPADEVKP